MDKRVRPRKCSDCSMLFLVLTSLLFVGGLQAEPLTLSGGVTSRFTDNATRSSSDKTSDAETRVNLSLGHQSDPGRCESRTAANVGYGIWHNETFDPQDYVALSFNGDCELVRGLSWTLSDNIRDVSANSRASDTPDNRTRKNVFRTGPVYSLMINPRNRVTLSAQYENTNFSEQEQTDSERYIGTAAWNHLFSQTLSGGLQFSTNQAELDTGTEIDTDTVSVLFSKSWQTTRVSGSIDVSEIESRFGGNIQSSDAVVGDLSLERDINPVTQFYIRASHELTDQTSDFDIRFDEFVFNLQETSQVEVSALDAGIARQFSDGSQLDLGVFASRSDFIESDVLEESGGVRVNYGRPLTELWSFQSGAKYQYRTYEQSLNDEIYSVEAGLNYKLSQKLGINGRVGHNARISEASAGESRENWVSLGLNYQFF